MLPQDYSWPERALALWSPVILSVLAVGALALRYVTDPIACWAPAQFTDNQVSHVHEKCFKSHQHYVLDRNIHPDDPEASMSQYTYHQWVPYAVGVAALLCILPHVLWRMLGRLLWMDAHGLMEMVADNQRHNAAGRHVMLRDTALLLQEALKAGNWSLTLAALARKALACVTCIMQIVLVIAVFNPQVRPDKEEDEASNEESRNFNDSLPLPEHFMCKFDIQRLQEVQRFQVQCALPLSSVYNKGLAIFYYIFLFLMICCILDLIIWVCRLFMPVLCDISIQRYLAVGETDLSKQPDVIQRFLTSLGPDGRLLVALIADHCGPLAAADMTHHLWHVFKGTPRPGAAPSVSLTPTHPDTHSSPAPSVYKTDGAAPDEKIEVVPMTDQGDIADTKPV